MVTSHALQFLYYGTYAKNAPKFRKHDFMINVHTKNWRVLVCAINQNGSDTAFPSDNLEVYVKMSDFWPCSDKFIHSRVTTQYTSYILFHYTLPTYLKSSPSLIVRLHAESLVVLSS